MEDEIRNLGILVDVVAKRVEAEIKRGNTQILKELLWNVPTNILTLYAKEENK